ncbi:MAG: S-methyl-5-thioribose-1-phosphate isomerase [archaeon]
MIDLKVKQVVRDIKNLKIQGASKVQEQAVKALIELIEKDESKHVKEFDKKLKENALLLLNSRPTEPKLRNIIRLVLKNMKIKINLIDKKSMVLKELLEFKKKDLQAKELITKFGAELIQKNNVILTHCHSHRVEDILIKAHNQRKKFKVYCTETRPFFQGRITARNLVKAGLNVTLIVDNTTNSIMKEADIFLTGADAITSTGNLINKIGTSLHSLSAKKNNTKHFTACTLSKFDPITLLGLQEPIEERNLKEVWDKPPKKLKIFNPVFDETPNHQITGYITEEGILSPQAFVVKALTLTDLKTSNHLSKLINLK